MRKCEAKKDLIVLNTNNPKWGLCFIVDIKRTALIEELRTNIHVRHFAPYGQLKEITAKNPDEIPLFDCSVCKVRDVPLIYKATMVKGDKEIDIYECAHCGKVPNIAKDIKITASVKLSPPDERRRNG